MTGHYAVHDNGKSKNGDLILFVEDDEDSRFVYRLLFENQGFQVLLAASGDEGLRLAREAMPSAIVMDVSVPGIDGWTATQRLKADPQMAGIPVIVLTAHAFPEDRHRAKAVGCDAFLTKPCEPRTVLEEVRRQIAGPGRPA
jgi:CheY-like chemotaxis protein